MTLNRPGFGSVLLGPRHQEFHAGDPFTRLLRQHDQISKDEELIKRALKSGDYQLGSPIRKDLDYHLGGLDGAAKYVSDYGTLADGGLTGNLAVTFLGSYVVTATPVAVEGKSATVHIVVTNRSTIQSATHPPVIGYTDWWRQNIGDPLDAAFSSGPMSPTTQRISWSERVTW